MPAASAGFGFEWPASAGLLAIVVVGAAIGFINGFLVVWLRLNAFIVTLAMLIVLRGMLVGATQGGTLFDMPNGFFTLATTIFLGLPLSVWLAAAAFATAAFVLRYHRLGRALYAIGGNPEAARAAGIRVERITWGVFVLGGVLAAVGGPDRHGIRRRDQRESGQRDDLHGVRGGGDRRHFARRRQGHDVRCIDRRAAARRRAEPVDARAGAVVLDSGDLRRDHPRLADGGAARGRRRPELNRMRRMHYGDRS